MAKDTTPSVKVKKTAKKEDYKLLSEKDLLEKIEQLRSDIFDLKKSTIIGDVQNVRAYKLKRRDLARALTVRNQAREAK